MTEGSSLMQFTAGVARMQNRAIQMTRGEEIGAAAARAADLAIHRDPRRKPVVIGIITPDMPWWSTQ